MATVVIPVQFRPEPSRPLPRRSIGCLFRTVLRAASHITTNPRTAKSQDCWLLGAASLLMVLLGTSCRSLLLRFIPLLMPTLPAGLCLLFGFFPVAASLPSVYWFAPFYSGGGYCSEVWPPLSPSASPSSLPAPTTAPHPLLLSLSRAYSIFDRRLDFFRH